MAIQPLTGTPGARLAEARQALDRGDHDVALRLLVDLHRRTSHPDVTLNLARARMARGDHAAARADFEAVIEAVPQADFPYLMVAECLRNEGRPRDAIEAVDRLLRLHPAHPGALTYKAELHHLLGDHEAGRRLLDPLVEKKLRDPRVLFVHGRLCLQLGDDRAAERSLSASFNSMPESAPPARRLRHQADCMYELARIHAGRGDHDRAWEVAEQANRAVPRPFDPDAHDAMVDRMIAAWTPEVFAAIEPADVTDRLPVHVLGMPRSGTSLVERIVGSHPDAFAAGERPHVHRAVRTLEPHEDELPARVERPGELDRAALAAAGRSVLEAMRAHAPEAARITDKQPFNAMHLPLLRRMLPGGTVLHCLRDPRDVAVSCWFEGFRGAVWFANDLEHIARFAAAHERLVDHWRRLLESDPHGAGDRVLEVPYEELVTSPEPWTRRIVEHVGLPWSDACLRPHESDVVTMTASLDQVRRPVHRSSVGRWRHYRRHLAPIIGEAAAAAEGDPADGGDGVDDASA